MGAAKSASSDLVEEDIPVPATDSVVDVVAAASEGLSVCELFDLCLCLPSVSPTSSALLPPEL